MCREGHNLRCMMRSRPRFFAALAALVAMLRANPEAFIAGNVNRLRAGAVLTQS